MKESKSTTTESLLVGDPVIILPLQRRGTIIEILSAKRYRVEAGKVTLTCKATDLVRDKAPDRGKQRPPSAAPPGTFARTTQRKKNTSFNTTLDLHGYSADNATSLLSQYISDAILAGHNKVQIVHGIGTGKVKTAVHAYLSSESAVKRYMVDPANPGTTSVYL